MKRLATGVALLVAVAAGVPASAQDSIYGGQEKQFAGHWSDWPNNYVASTLSDYGQPLIPLFEGWFPNPDGTFSLSFDYMNMNFEQTFQIPIGPDNFLEPAEFNGMQPTFFMPAQPRGREGESRHYRHQATFSIKLPADWRREDDVVWTLRYDGKTVKVPGRTRVETYRLEDLEAFTSAPQAPAMSLERGGAEGRGRLDGPRAGPLRARVGVPIELTAHVRPLTGEPHLVFWFDHQGAAAVTFEPQQMQVPGEGGDATTSATFSQPGEYMIRVSSVQTLAAWVQHCCYTNGYLKVTVTP